MATIDRRTIAITIVYSVTGTVSALVAGTLVGRYSVGTALTALAIGLTMGLVTLGLQLTGFGNTRKPNEGDG